MKKRKKLLLMLSCITLVCALVTGCASKEARQVISHINALGKISLESSEELRKVNSEYASLSDEDKSDVSNYSKLKKANRTYNDLKSQDLNERIKNSCTDITAEQINELNGLYEEYNSLNEDGKAQVSNIKLLEESLTKVRQLNANKVVDEIVNKANGDIDGAKSLLDKNYPYMTSEQINTCLIEIGRWDSVREAEKYFKNYLKNPSSYIRYSGSCAVPELQEDGTYKVKVKLDYGATNSFNAMVRDEIEFYVYFLTEIEKRNVDYTKTDLTAYYKWKVAK